MADKISDENGQKLEKGKKPIHWEKLISFKKVSQAFLSILDIFNMFIYYYHRPKAKSDIVLGVNDLI